MTGSVERFGTTDKTDGSPLLAKGNVSKVYSSSLSSVRGSLLACIYQAYDGWYYPSWTRAFRELRCEGDFHHCLKISSFVVSAHDGVCRYAKCAEYHCFFLRASSLVKPSDFICRELQTQSTG